MYARVAQSLPSTSYIKVIEIWLLFHLVIPFFIFFVLFWQEHKPQHRINVCENKHTNKNSTGFENEDKYLTKVSAIGLPLIIVTFVFIFFIICFSGY